LANVKEHAPPPLGSEGKEIEELHGGCCDSTCSASSIPGVQVRSLAIHRPTGGRLHQIETTDEAEESTWDGVAEGFLEEVDSWEKQGSALKALVANLLMMLPRHEATEVLACCNSELSRGTSERHQSRKSQRSPDQDECRTPSGSAPTSSPCRSRQQTGDDKPQEPDDTTCADSGNSGNV
jgi:hypothetical protein